MEEGDLTDRLVTIYDKYYTLEDVKALNAFYDGPTGQKILASLPMVMDETTKVGQNWGNNIRQETLDEAKVPSGQ